MISKALIAASTKPLLLSIILSGESYGYQIIQNVKIISKGQLEWSEGMLYPVLHRLEKDGFVIANWRLSEKGRMRKYYRITEEGKKELASEKKQWMNVHNALTRLWEPAPAIG